jgi:7-carboxy-7-deazaguanine synthase
MFGKNSLMKKDHGNGESLHVVKGSPWLTIQGEGPYSGHPAVFVRLHGCHLRCIFCDTDFDATDDPIMTRDDLLHRIWDIRGAARLVVITGGEPLRQNILPLCRDLKMAGFRVQIETAGTFWIDGLEQAVEIVCSPKTPTIHPMIEKYAAAFKYVISGSQSFGSFHLGYVPYTATQPKARPASLAPPRDGAPVYLSPMDEQDDDRNQFNRELVGSLAIEHGCIAGVQLHKYIGVD